MSLDKAIEHGKEKRKQYFGSKAIDHTCRNHGTCGWCEDDRLYHVKKTEDSMEDRFREYKNEKDKSESMQLDILYEIMNCLQDQKKKYG